MSNDAIDLADPYQLYSTIDECDMMSNFHLSSPGKSTRSRDILKRPPSLSLLQSCCHEMDKKGLGLFHNYQNIQTLSDKAQKPQASSLEKWNHNSATNKNHLLQHPPIPCGGKFITSAEIHNCYLEAKPDSASSSKERDNSEDLDNVQGNSKTHAVSLGAGLKGGKPSTDKEAAGSDKEQSTSSPDDYNSPPIQYEDALSIYEVYIL